MLSCKKVDKERRTAGKMLRRALRLAAIIVVIVVLGYLIGSFTLQPEVPLLLKSGFVVANLRIQPPEVEPNEVVSITVSVYNTHDTWGIYSLVLYINDVKETEGQVMVSAASTQDITFSVMREEPGSYAVFINGLSGSFTVVPAEEAEVTKEVTINPKKGV